MVKFINNKFFLFYAMASIVLLMFIFGIFSQIISKGYVNAQKQDLIKEANSIGNAYLDTIIDYPTHDILIAKSYFKYKFNSLCTESETHTILVDTHNAILIDSVTDDFNTLDIMLKNKMIQEALSGKVVVDTGVSRNKMDQLQVSVAVPMARNDKTYGVVLMHLPYPIMNKNINYIYKITFITLLAVLALSFIFTYIYSNQTKRTLDALVKTSKEVASGDFSSRITPPYSNEFSELAKNMNIMAEDLGKLEDMRKDFIANISHDFRSPLTSIKGFVQAILDGTISYEKQNKYLTIVLDESERLTQLTNNILLLTKMENHQIVLEKVTFDIHSVLNKVLLQFEPQINKKHLSLTLLMSKKEVLVFADLNQIQRVLYNIIDNAVKFCQNEDKIIIETHTTKDKVEISITDTGQGILQEHIHYIWDRFYKEDRSRGKDKKGTGIGLSIVKEIIKAHEERIDVLSQPGKGTTFTFTLPLSTKKR